MTIKEFVSTIILEYAGDQTKIEAYHGTSSFLPFKKFSPNMIGTGIVSNRKKYGGFFFTTEKENAEFYSEYFICKVVIDPVYENKTGNNHPPTVMKNALEDRKNYLIKDVLDGSVYSDVIVVPENNLNTISIINWEFIGDEEDVFDKWDEFFLGGDDGIPNKDMIDSILETIDEDLSYLLQIPIFKKYYSLR